MNKDELQESLFTRGFRKNLIFVGVFALCISAMFASGYLVKKANAATTDSMMVYDTQTITTTPKYRLWNGSSWDSEASATPISGDIAHMEVKYAPTRDEAIMIIQSTTGEISAQVFNGSSWGSKTVLGTITGNGLGPDQQALNGRCFDIFYEQTSGDAIVVYCDNTADPDYQVWNGTSWTGSGINIDIPTTGLVNAIEVANRVGSDEGAFIIVDANSDVYGMRWTGSAWSNMGTATTWETTASLATKKPIDVAFERTSGDIMFSWGFATAATAHFRYRTYTQSNSTLNAVTNVTNANNGGVVHWLQLAPDPATSSDKIMIGLLDAGSDLNTFEWSGTAWSAVHTEHSGGTEDFVDMNFDLVYETHSSHASDVWLTFGDSATVTRKKWDAGAWGTSTTTGDDTAFTAMVAQPNSGAVLAVAYEDNTSATDDIRSFQITGGGTTWSGNTTIWAGPVARNLGFTRVDLAGQAYSSSTEAIMVYDNEDMVTTPKFRVWDGTAWGSEQNANNVNGDTFFMTIKFAPTRDEAILVTYGSTGDIQAQVWNGTSWGSPTLIGNDTGNGLGPDLKAVQGRAFDIRYENTSGDAVIVYADNTADPDYKIWDGTNWSASGTNIDIATSGQVNWITMADDQRAGSDALAIITLDANVDVYGMRWDGGAWDDMNAGGTEAVWDATASIATKEAISVAFEKTSGDLMFAWGDGTATTHLNYRTYVSTTLSAVTALANANQGGVAHWVKMVSDYSSDSNKILLAEVDAGADLNTFEWSGTAWGGVQTEHSATVEDILDRNFDIVYETHASHSGDAWLTFGNNATVTRKKLDNGTWGTSTTTGDDTAFTVLAAHPDTGVIFNAVYEDNTSATDDIITHQITGGGTTWSGNTTIWGGPVARNMGVYRIGIDSERHTPIPTTSVDLSGTCDGFDQTTDCGDTGTIRVAVNGALAAQTQATVAGTWSVTSVSVPDDAIITVFIDGAADSDEAVAVMKWDNSGNIDNIRLYKEHLTIGTDGGLNSGQTLTIDDIDSYDVSQDEDVFFDFMTSGTCNGISSFTGLCVDGSGTSSQERLTILSGNTFTPGGSVISANLEVLGTLSGTNDITLTSGSATGSGTVNLTGGTFLVDGAGNFGSNSNWTFNNLILGDGSGSTTTTATGSGDITVTGTLTIEANQTLSAGAKTYILSGTSQGGGFRNHGTFTAGTSTVRYTGLSTGLVDYKDLFQQYSTQYWGTAGWTSNSFTPTAGKRLFVILGGIHESSVDIASNLTLSDSQGLIWTSIGTVNESTPWSYGVRAFISSVVPTTTSTTVTADAGSLDMSYYIVSITEVAGSDGTVTGFVADNNMNSDGAESLTLSQSPATGSLGVFMKFLDEGALTASPTMGAGWTLISHLADQNNLHPFSVAVRPNMSGTTVTIDDMSSGATGSAFKTLGMAFSIEPGASGIAPASYHNLELVPNTNSTTFTLGSGTFNVSGNLTIGNGTNTGVVINADTNDPILNIDGDLIISANSTFTASSSSSFHLAGDFTNNGTFTNSSGSIIFDDSGQTSVISGNNTFNNFTVATAGKNIQFTSGSTTTINGLLTVTGSNGNNVVFTSTTGSSSWTINHQGTENITYLTVSWGACHASSTAIDMTGTGNTNGGNNGTCWTFPVSGITISGVVYQSDGTTPDGTGYTLNISTNGGIGTTTTSNGSGVFSFADFNEPTAGDVVTIWLDSSEASLVLKYGSSCTGNPNCTGLSLVQGQVRLQSFNGTSFTNDDLDSCDNDDGGFGCNTTSIGFNSDGTNLTVDTDRTLVIASGTTFAPGGSSNVSTGGLSILGTYTASSGILTIGGNFTNAGTFTAGSGTVVFNDANQTSQILGSTAFYTLSSTTQDKVLEFESGETFTITNQLTLTGANGHPIVLTGTASSPWYIDIEGSASVARVTVSWGGCEPGSNTVQLGSNSTNAGNNDSCWRFIIVGAGGGSSGSSGGAGSGSSGGGGGESGGEPRTAAATATIQAGAVDGVVVTDGGLGYSTAPLVCFEQGSPSSEATGTAVLTNGVVSSINVTFAGTGYQSAPTVVIRPPGSPTGTCAAGGGGGGSGGGGGGSP